MGQGFSLTTLSAGSAGIDVPELSDLVYEGTLGTARFMKSIRARHHDGVVMVKVVVKPYSMSLQKYRKIIIKERNALADIPNALGYQRILESDTNGYLVRQYVHSSLYDRMSTRPFLEDIEKKWLAFQLLCAVRDCHARDIFHGDIKTENTLVTSWNWLYLTDFSSSYKPTTLPEDNPADFSYFFDTAGRRTCYLAPERFLAPGELPEENAKVTWAMDVFSVGCVIAELFLEAPFFNLSQLFKYRKGEYDPTTSQLQGIKDTGIREMVAHMIQVDPNNRYSAEEYLNFFKGKVFPEYFDSFLHHYMGVITDPSSGRFPISGSSANLGEADDRIDRIWNDFDKISFFLGYEDNSGRSGNQGLKKLDVRKAGINILPVHLNIPNNEHYIRPLAKGGLRPADDGALIFLALIASSIRNTARTTARIKACDLLLAFSERLPDEAKLDRVLPYLYSLLTDKSDVVKVAALRSMTQLMALVSVISPVNANIFPEYILTRIDSIIFPKSPKNRPSAMVRATYAACIGSLATTAARFLHIVSTLKMDESLPADPVDKDDESAEENYQGLFDIARAELVDRFEDQTIALITDSDASVRRVFLGSVPEMCIFFGTAKSSDIILSHLNTYLNDRDWFLKCAFFETVVGIAAFLGSQSVEEFILPLMVQALTDPEDFVVERVLRSLANLAELGLLQRGKTWEVVDVVGRFTMHPNIWIREAAVNCLSRATKFLSASDNQCIIVPLIRPYLRVNVKDFDELSLLDALKKPLPKAIVDLAITWAQKVDRGVFWKPVNRLNTFSFGGAGRTVPTISSKELGPNALGRIPRNEEDEQWLSKLRNMGMGQDDEWKLLALREYIWRVAMWKSRESPNTDTAYLNNIINLRDHKVAPQTILFDDTIMDEPLRPIQTPSDDGNKGTHTIADALLDASMTIDDSLAKRRRSAINNHRARAQNPDGLTIDGRQSRRHTSLSPSPISPSSISPSSTTRRSSALMIEGTPRRKPSDDDSSTGDPSPSNNIKTLTRALGHKSSAMSLLNRRETSKSVPETSTTSTNVFGKVETPFTQDTNQQSALALAKEQEDITKVNVRFRASHTYYGHDPNILHMLDSMYIDNYPSDVVEFGPLVTPMSRRKPINRSSVQSTDKPWRPEGILVTTFAEHIGPATRVVVAPDHVFFITGGDDGTVKVWDSARLERNIAHRSRQTYKHAVGSKITSLCFIENTHCFVSAASDGTVNVVKVDYQNGGGISKYGKLRVLREYQLPKDEIAIWSDHFKLDTSSVLILATNKSRVLAIDLRTMKNIYTLENPVHHGTPTAFCIDRKRTWLLLGTSHGVLDLWDLRFRVRVRAWGVPGATSIYRISLHPFKGRGRWVCVAGGSGQGEVTVWDIEKVQCREVYRAGGSRDGPKGYEPWPVDEDRPEGMLGRFATSLEPSGSPSADRGVRAMVVGSDTMDDGRDRYGFLITGGSDKKIRFWDLVHVENSMVVSGLEADETKSTFTASHPTASLTLNTERLPRPGPTSPNAATGAGAGAGRNSSSGGSSAGGGTKVQSGKAPRSTVISLQQQQLLKAHLDSILDVALLEWPYGMSLSVDRSGVVYVFQ